jgi:hypothetical protein
MSRRRGWDTSTGYGCGPGWRGGGTTARRRRRSSSGTRVRCARCASPAGPRRPGWRHWRAGQSRRRASHWARPPCWLAVSPRCCVRAARPSCWRHGWSPAERPDPCGRRAAPSPGRGCRSRCPRRSRFPGCGYRWPSWRWPRRCWTGWTGGRRWTRPATCWRGCLMTPPTARACGRAACSSARSGRCCLPAPSIALARYGVSRFGPRNRNVASRSDSSPSVSISTLPSPIANPPCGGQPYRKQSR